MSDHVGFKFVEPVSFDLGRVFSDGRASQPLVALAPDSEGAAAIAAKVARLAAQKKQPIKVFSMGEESERECAMSALRRAEETGEAWIMLENFHLENEADRIMCNHTKEDAHFHPSYRLWVVTKETSNVIFSFLHCSTVLHTVHTLMK